MTKKKTNEHQTHTNEHIEQKHNPYKKEAGLWKIVSIIASVLFVVALIIIITTSGEMTGDISFTDDQTVDYTSIGTETVNFLSNNFPVTGLELVSITEENDLLKQTMTIEDQELIIYTSKDGEIVFIPGGAPINKTEFLAAKEETENQENIAVEVIKADKPKVEAFIMSHCPYGTQFEKGLLPVIETLGDSMDFEIKFVNYAMHGEVEVNEQLLQYCIQKDNKQKYYEYLSCFLGEGDTDSCLEETEITRESLSTCISETDTQFNLIANLEDEASYVSGRFSKFMIHNEENELYGVQGSPTLVINGEIVSAARDPASLLEVICSSFNTQPEACSIELDSAAPSPGFGYEGTGSSSNGQCG